MRWAALCAIILSALLTSARTSAQTSPDDGTPPIQPPRADLVGMRSLEVQFMPGTPPEEQAAAHRAAGAVVSSAGLATMDGYSVVHVVMPTLAVSAALSVYLTRPSVRFRPGPPPSGGGRPFAPTCTPEEIAAGRTVATFTTCVTPQGFLNLYPVTAWVVFAPNTPAAVQAAAHEAAGAEVWSVDDQPGATVALVTVPVRTEDEVAGRYDRLPGVRGVVGEVDTRPPASVASLSSGYSRSSVLAVTANPGRSVVRETVIDAYQDREPPRDRSFAVTYSNVSALNVTIPWQGIVAELGIVAGPDTIPAVRSVVLSPGGTRIRLLSLSEGIVCATVAENFLVYWATAGQREVMFTVDEAEGM